MLFRSPLLHRDRKGVVLTDAGLRLLETGRVMEQEFSALLTAIRDTGRAPAGVVRGRLPLGLPTSLLAAIQTFIHQSWPRLQVRLAVHEAPLVESLTD